MTVTGAVALAAPFRGLAPFGDTELDALLFFGRERETEIAVANLLASRLTILYGPTGVGKSSLLQAGVARRVHELGGRRAIGRGPDSAAIVFSAWADDPMAALAEAIADEVTGLIERSVPRPPPGTSLADVVEYWAAVLDGDLYLVLDQLEEYFVYSENGGPRSFELEFPEIVLRPRLRANVLLSLRDDALAQLDVFKGSLPNLFANYLRLDRLDRAAATAAIKGPIQRWNELVPDDARVEIEPQLVEDVLAQAAATGEPDRVEPPYLQLVLERLWNEERDRGSRTLRAATLAELGGAGAIVREHLDRALSVLDDRERDAAALMFDHLVTPSGTKVAHRTADLAKFARVPEPEAETVLGALGRERILRSLDEGTGSGVRFEIFHDVLADAILGWRGGRELEHERLAARRHRRNLVAVALASLLAVAVMAAITVFALTQRGSARSHANSANARALAATALTQLDTDPELSLLLARRAASLSNSTLVEGVLRSALLDSRVRHVVQLGGPGVAAVFQRGTGRAVGVTSNGRVVVAQAATGQVVERASIRARRVLLDPVGHRVLGYGLHTVPRLLDIASRSTLPLRTHGVVSGVFSPNGELLATANLHHRLQVWESATGRIVRTLEAPSLQPAVAFSPNGELLAVADGRNVAVRDLTTGRVTVTIPEPSIVAHVAFGPNSRLLAVAGLDKIVRLHNAVTGARVATYTGQVGQVTAVAFSPSTALLATTSTDGTARVWRTDGRGSFVSPLIGHQNSVTSAAFSPNGYRVVTASKDRTARVWQAVSGDPVAVLAGNADSVTSGAFSDDGRTVVTSSADGAMRFWYAVAQPELALRVQKPWPVAAARVARGGIVIAPRGGRDVSVSADGTRYVSVDSGRIVVRQAPTGAEAASFPARGWITGVAIAPDGASVAVGGANGTARIYNLRGELVRTLRAGRAPLTHLAFSPDGRLLAAGSTDHTAKLWSLSTGALRVLAGHDASVLSARFDAAGTGLVTASMDHDARLWDLATGRTIQILRGHFGKVSDAGFSPDGRWVVTAGPGKAGLWDARSGSLLFFLQGHTAALTSASFAPDDRTIVTSSVDGTVRSYVCEVCAGVPGLVRLADRRLAQTNRQLTPAELRALVP